jgi:hypothetical protein
MLSILTTLEGDELGAEFCLRAIWLVKRPFEHVVVLNGCSADFELRIKVLVDQTPDHVTVKVATDPIAVATKGLEELLTPVDNEHSRIQFRKRCMAQCSQPWVLLTTVAGLSSPEWVQAVSDLRLDLYVDPYVAISMPVQSHTGQFTLRPVLFNFAPEFQRHYWWPVFVPDDEAKCVDVAASPPNSLQNSSQNAPRSALQDIVQDTPCSFVSPCNFVSSREPWFAGQEPTLESAWQYARCLLPAGDAKEFIPAATKLFAADGTFRDSRHSTWVDLGATGIHAVRHQNVENAAWRMEPLVQAMDQVSPEEAKGYWAQIRDVEFNVADLQPICTECDREGSLAAAPWPDGLIASPTTLKHVWHALFVLDRIQVVEHVVEVGAGYGAFAKAFLLCAQLCNRPVCSYTIVELPAMRALCEQYLAPFQQVLRFGDPTAGGADVPDHSVFVSFDGVSELADAEKRRYLETLLPRAKSACLLWACTEIPEQLFNYYATMDLFLPNARILIYGANRS